MGYIEYLKQRRDALMRRLRHIENELDSINKELMGSCHHEWKRMQVAGEGKYCMNCGKLDYSDD